MSLPTTENLPQHKAIDALSAADAAEFLLAGQRQALEAVGRSASQITKGAEVMAQAVRAEKSLVYAAAGSSGLMALADASELPGTFGINPDAIQIHMAGGVPTDGQMPGDTEDDALAATRAMDAVTAGDVVIALSASGTTPFAVAAAKLAKGKGATVIGVANNPDTDLLHLADVPICLDTPPEVVAGSTRLGAGTAQKAALNLMSTLMGVELGHVFQGQMVNLVADNAKLVQRAARMVSQIASVDDTTAKAALQKAQGDTKAAILIAAGASLATARELLAAQDGHLGPCLQAITTNQDETV